MIAVQYNAFMKTPGPDNVGRDLQDGHAASIFSSPRGSPSWVYVSDLAADSATASPMSSAPAVQSPFIRSPTPVSAKPTVQAALFDAFFPTHIENTAPTTAEQRMIAEIEANLRAAVLDVVDSRRSSTSMSSWSEQRINTAPQQQQQQQQHLQLRQVLSFPRSEPTSINSPIDDFSRTTTPLPRPATSLGMSASTPCLSSINTGRASPVYATNSLPALTLDSGVSMGPAHSSSLATLESVSASPSSLLLSELDLGSIDLTVRPQSVSPRGVRAVKPTADDKTTDGVQFGVAAEASTATVSVSAGATPKTSRRRLRGQDGDLVCANCATTETARWRICNKTGDVLCNACGIYKRIHGIPRPEECIRRDRRRPRVGAMKGESASPEARAKNKGRSRTRSTDASMAPMLDQQLHGGDAAKRTRSD